MCVCVCLCVPVSVCLCLCVCVCVCVCLCERGGDNRNDAVDVHAHHNLTLTPSNTTRLCTMQAQFQHPNVVGLVGVVTAGEPMLMVIEFCEHGALNSYLAKNDTTLHDKLAFATDCAAGLEYLSQRG